MEECVLSSSHFGKKKMTYTVVNVAMPTNESASFASFINASGEIAGNVADLFVGDPVAINVNAVTWSSTGAATVLSASNGVTGLNDAGDVVGYEVIGGGQYQQALLWSVGSTEPIILNDAGGYGFDSVYAINSAGDSVASPTLETDMKEFIGLHQVLRLF